MATNSTTLATVLDRDSLGGITERRLQGTGIKAYLDSVSGAIVQSADFTLTAAQVNDGENTPVELVAAPGANKILIPVACYLKMTYNSSAFNAVNLQVIYAGDSVTRMAFDGIEATADTFWVEGLKASALTGSTVDPVNKALQIETSGDAGAGDSTFVGTIFYRVEDLA